jgi:DNA-directed RNA polymerase beta subunit
LPPPIFDGATLEQISEYTDKAGIPRFGETRLIDGENGEPFDQPATVGIILYDETGAHGGRQNACTFTCPIH